MYSYGPPCMAKQKQDDQLEHTYNSYVRIRDVALKTYQRRWSGERGSGISVLEARHDDDDDNDIYIYIYIYIYIEQSIGWNLSAVNKRTHMWFSCKNGLWVCVYVCMSVRANKSLGSDTYDDLSLSMNSYHPIW